MNTETRTLDELIHSMHEQVARLITVSEIDPKDLPDPRDEVVRQQMRRATELVRGAAALGAAQNPACLGIIGRSLLEQLISSLWLTKISR